jgi:hypothetical protein
MRATCGLVISSLGFFLAACSGSTENHAPPALDRQMLVGKWEADEPEQLLQALEFSADQSFRMTIKQVPETVPGTYTWSGNASLAVEYRPSDEAKKACKATLAAVKQDFRERGKKAGGSIGAGLEQAADDYPDELPAKEELRIGMSDRYGPVLVVISAKGLNFRFKKRN